MPNLDIIKNLAQNISLFSFLLLLPGFFWNKIPPRYVNIIMGSILGLVSIAAMNLPVTIVDGVNIDARTILVGLAGYYFGIKGGAPAFALAASYRLSMGGIGVEPSIIALFAACSIGMYWNKKYNAHLMSIYSLGIFGLLAATTSILSGYLFLPEPLASSVINKIIIPVLLAYPLGIIYYGELIGIEFNRFQAIQKLGENESKQRAMIENISDVVTILDPNGVIQYSSPNIIKLFGWLPEELIGKIAWENIYPDDIDKFKKYFHINLSKTNSIEKIEFRTKCKNGSFNWVAFTGRNLTKDPHIQGILCNFHDITEKKISEKNLKSYYENLENLVQERTAELKISRDAAETANQAKTMFLANMSHEIRTPIHGILGMVASLRRTGVSPQQEDRLNKIDTATEHLLGLINDVLDLSKIEAGRLALEKKSIDINNLLTNTISILSERAESKGLHLSIETETWPDDLYGDSIRIQQALLNYANNAVKFTEQGSIIIRAIKKKETEDSILIHFEVQDTGIGIPAKTLAKLFNLFEQADNSTTRKYGGTGLGLVITKLLAELMGGEAGADSTPSVGSTFWFTAMVKKHVKTITNRDSPKNENPEKKIAQIHSGKHILVADDEPINRELVQLLLEDANLIVTIATNGLEAIDKALASDFDLIIMDMQMPFMGGLEATRSIRKTPQIKQAPIIAMTANAFTEDKYRCIEAGMNDILVKPFNTEKLFEKVFEWLSQNKNNNN